MIDLKYFTEDEFDHPDLMDPEFLKKLDLLRDRCGFPLKVNDDARTEEELRELYKDEIKAGKKWPSDSAHAYVDNVLVRAIDLKPVSGSHIDKMMLVFRIIEMWREGHFPHLGLIVETAHVHLDDTPRIAHKRPYFGVGVSR